MKNNKLQIRRALKKDVKEVLLMTGELTETEGGECLFTKTDFLAGAFGKQRNFEMLIALYQQKYAGYISWHAGYDIQSASKGFYLIDLYVRKQYRRRKIGYLLMSELSKIVSGDGGKWISWHVKPTNRDAISFYKRFGAMKTNASQFVLEVED